MGWNTRLETFILTAFIVALASQHVSCKVHGHSANRKLGSVNGGFIRQSGTHFTLNGKSVYFNGFNAYWLMYMASDPSTRPKVTATFQEASCYGLNVARTWAFSDGGYRALQISPGSYDEQVFQGLDFVISEAGKNGIRLILSLANNWKDFGGKNQYVDWAKGHGQHVTNEDDFFTNSLVKQYYKSHINSVLTRKNKMNGVAYKDDPTILAWELMNEPRNPSDLSGKIIQSWVREMAAYVKSIDSNHLLEVGLEGFYGETMPERKQQINPGYQVGTDFISNNQVPEIDFATIHLYPEQWVSGSESAQDAFVDRWIQAHMQDASQVLKKPILIAEFGKSSKLPGYTVKSRDSYYQKLYDAIYKSASSGGPCAGGLFWQLLARGMEGMRDGYEVVLEESPSTANVIAQQSHKLSGLV